MSGSQAGLVWSESGVLTVRTDGLSAMEEEEDEEEKNVEKEEDEEEKEGHDRTPHTFLSTFAISVSSLSPD